MSHKEIIKQQQHKQEQKEFFFALSSLGMWNKFEEKNFQDPIHNYLTLTDVVRVTAKIISSLQ